MDLLANFISNGIILVEMGGTSPNGPGQEVNEARRKWIGAFLILFYCFLAPLVGRCLLRSFRASAPNGISLMETLDQME